MQLANAHEAMPDHERDGRFLPPGQRQELRRGRMHCLAVERHIVGDTETVGDGIQHQRVFGGLPEQLRLLDQRARLFEGRSGVRRRKALRMHLCVRERHLERDLIAAQGGRARQSRDLGQRPRELPLGFHRRRTRQRSLSGFPQRLAARSISPASV